MAMSEVNQIRMITIRAFAVLHLKLSGWQIAYHRSIEIKVSVRIDTKTETP